MKKHAGLPTTVNASRKHVNSVVGMGRMGNLRLLYPAKQTGASEDN